MKRITTLVLGLALVGTTVNLYAQQGPRRGGGPQGPGPHGPGPQGFPPPIAILFDSDKNGVLNETEILASSQRLLTLDKNQDGQLTADEICVGGPGSGECPFGNEGRGQGQHKGFGKGKGKGKGQSPMGPQGQAPLCLRLFDADTNGTLSSAEIANAPVVLAALDANNDDVVSPDELRPRNGSGRGAGAGMCQ